MRPWDAFFLFWSPNPKRNLKDIELLELGLTEKRSTAVTWGELYVGKWNLLYTSDLHLDGF